jgi:hypothetical protein
MAQVLVAGHSSSGSGFDTKSLHVGFVVEESALNVFFRGRLLSPVSIIPPMLHTH